MVIGIFNAVPVRVSVPNLNIGTSANDMDDEDVAKVVIVVSSLNRTESNVTEVGVKSTIAGTNNILTRSPVEPLIILSALAPATVNVVPDTLKSIVKLLDFASEADVSIPITLTSAGSNVIEISKEKTSLVNVVSVTGSRIALAATSNPVGPAGIVTAF